MAIRAKLNIKKLIETLTSPLSILGDFTSDKYDVVNEDVLPDILARDIVSLDSRVDNYVPGKGFVRESREENKGKNISHTRNSGSRNIKKQEHSPDIETSKARQIDDEDRTH